MTDGIQEAADYIPPVRYGTDRYGTHGGMSITSNTPNGVWDVLHDLIQKHQLLAAAYRAEHPADDNDLVTPDWLNSLHRVGGDMSMFAVRLVDHEIRLMSPCNKPTEGIDGLRDYVAPRHATRGDVRRLAKALGIELIEG